VEEIFIIFWVICSEQDLLGFKLLQKRFYYFSFSLFFWQLYRNTWRKCVHCASHL